MIWGQRLLCCWTGEERGRKPEISGDMLRRWLQFIGALVQFGWNSIKRIRFRFVLQLSDTNLKLLVQHEIKLKENNGYFIHANTDDNVLFHMCEPLYFSAC